MPVFDGCGSALPDRREVRARRVERRFRRPRGERKDIRRLRLSWPHRVGNVVVTPLPIERRAGYTGQLERRRDRRAEPCRLLVDGVVEPREPAERFNRCRERSDICWLRFSRPHRVGNVVVMPLSAERLTAGSEQIERVGRLRRPRPNWIGREIPAPLPPERLCDRRYRNDRRRSPLPQARVGIGVLGEYRPGPLQRGHW